MIVSAIKFRPAHVLTISGIILVAIVAVIFSARVATVAAGALTLGLALVRGLAPKQDAIAARSVWFDTTLLTLLGSAMLILALTADNIS